MIKNEDIQCSVEVAAIEDRMRDRLRWFGHVNRRFTNGPVRKCDYKIETQGKKGR